MKESKPMLFDEWKRKLVKLMKGKVHLIPDDNTIYGFWEGGETPEAVAKMLKKAD